MTTTVQQTHPPEVGGKTDKRLFVVHFTNDWSNEVHTSYFYVNADANIGTVRAMIGQFDQGDADPSTASHPIELRHWNDVDPACYPLIFFAEDRDLEQNELTLLDFMRRHSVHRNTENEVRP